MPEQRVTESMFESPLSDLYTVLFIIAACNTKITHVFGLVRNVNYLFLNISSKIRKAPIQTTLDASRSLTAGFRRGWSSPVGLLQSSIFLISYILYIHSVFCIIIQTTVVPNIFCFEVNTMHAPQHFVSWTSFLFLHTGTL